MPDFPIILVQAIRAGFPRQPAALPADDILAGHTVLGM